MPYGVDLSTTNIVIGAAIFFVLFVLFLLYLDGRL